MNILDNKIALVTGSSRGIGKAIALKLGQMGATVFIHYAHSEEKAAATQKAVSGEGGKAELVKGDFSTMEGVRNLLRKVDERLDGRGLDILVNNAGIPHPAGNKEINEEQFDRLVQVNFKSPFFLTQHLLDKLNDHGRIINISSRASKHPTQYSGVYGMTKAALDNFTVQMASMLGSRKITVNSVAAGPIHTDMNREQLMNDQIRVRLENDAAMKGIGSPGDIAGVVAFLASPDAGWITGQWIEVSGGLGL